MKPLKNETEKILKKIEETKTVNSYKEKDITVNSSIDKKVNFLMDELKDNPDWLAKKLAKDLDDNHSLDYYKILTREHNPEPLLEALSYTLDAARQNKIKAPKWAYFKGILRNKGFKTKFKDKRR